MASIFSGLAAGARDAHESYFADAANVSIAIPGVAQPVLTPAILHKVRTVTRRDDSNRTNRVTVRFIRLPKLSTIQHNARVTIGTEVWSVDEVGDLQASGLLVQLIRTETHLAGRPGYRGQAPTNLSSGRG
jgi:hypothetical protein